MMACAAPISESKDVVVNEESSKARMERRKSSLARGLSLEQNFEEIAKLLHEKLDGDVAVAAAAAAAAVTAAVDGAAVTAPAEGSFFKVLVAVDAGHWSWFAFDWYLKNLHRPDNEVICFHKMDKPNARGDDYGEPVDALMKGYASNAQDLCHEYMKRLEDNKVNGRVLSQYSGLGIGESILDAAMKEKADMVVVGTRGSKGAVRRTLMGSVSDFVLHNAHCPVVVCCHERSRRRSSKLSASNSISED